MAMEKGKDPVQEEQKKKTQKDDNSLVRNQKGKRRKEYQRWNTGKETILTHFNRCCTEGHWKIMVTWQSYLRLTSTTNQP